MNEIFELFEGMLNSEGFLQISNIINIVLGFSLIIIGLLYGKFSKSSKSVRKRNTMILCLIGTTMLIFNGYRMLAGTNTTPLETSLQSINTGTIGNIHISSEMSNILNISVGGIALFIGFFFRKKEWGKITIFIGVISVTTGISMLLINLFR